MGCTSGKLLIDSYYHDTSQPATQYTLTELLERGGRNNTSNYIIWAKPYSKLTHKEFYSQAMILAKGLLAIGMKRGDTVCSFGSQGCDPMLLLVACASLGIKYTANYLYAPISNVINMMITKIQPDVVLVGNFTSGSNQEHVCTEFTKIIEGESHGVRHIIYDRRAEEDPDCKIQGGWRSLSSIMELGKTSVTDETLAAAKALVTNEDPILYLCSSGSTGEPKIITVCARTFANGVVNVQRRSSILFTPVVGVNDMTEGDVKLVTTTLNALGAGQNLVVHAANNSQDENEAVHEILTNAAKYKTHILFHRQNFIVKIVNTPMYKKQYNLSSLLNLSSAGCLASLEFKKKMMEFAPLSLDMYSGTEFLNSVSFVPMKRLPKNKFNSVGRPAPNVEMKIVDEEGRTVPVNTKGELLVRGWPLFLEYKDQPELTAQAMDKDGWYMTGDMVSMDEEGYLFIFGRMSKSERWKVNTRVIYSVSVESVLMTHPQIRSCTVIGTDNGGGHDLNYVIEPAPDSGLTAADVKKFAEEKMYNSQEWPIRIFFYTYDELPKTSGARTKINRGALTEEITLRVKDNPSDGLV